MQNNEEFIQLGGSLQLNLGLRTFLKLDFHFLVEKDYRNTVRTRIEWYNM